MLIGLTSFSRRLLFWHSQWQLPLRELEILKKAGVLVAGIRRQGETIINPTGTDRLAEGDELLILGSPQHLRHFKKWLMYFSVEGDEGEVAGF